MSTKLTDQQIADIKRFWDEDPDSLHSLLIPESDRKGLMFNIPGVLFGLAFEPSERSIPIDMEQKFTANFFRVRAESIVSDISERLRSIICDDLNYCELRKKLKSEGAALAIAVADGLISSTLMIPIPITALSVYLIKKGILDQLCQCDKK